MSYAQDTSVTEDRSRQEIERMLMKYGASRFGCLSDYEHKFALIEFTYKKIAIQMQIPVPDRQDKKFTRCSGRMSAYRRDESSAQKLYEQEVRRKWRSLSLALKAKLVAVEDGITTFETEFMPYMVTDNGQTLAERFQKSIIAAATTGRLCLPGPVAPADENIIDAEVA